MRAREIAAFGFGFAAGVLCLGIGLWSTGRVVASKPVALATPTPPLDVLRNPPPQVQTPVPAPVELEADRQQEPERLGMPIAGIDPAKLHSNFSETRDGHRHEALDIMAPRGTPVLAVAEGNIAKLFTSKDGGLTIYQFNNGRTVCYYYAHLDHYAAGLKEGMVVRKGEVIGYAGSTGDAAAKAPHLHFAIFLLGPEKQWWKGTPVDPLPYLQGKSAPGS